MITVSGVRGYKNRGMKRSMYWLQLQCANRLPSMDFDPVALYANGSIPDPSVVSFEQFFHFGCCWE